MAEKVTPEEARKILEDAQRERMAACQKELAPLLQQVAAAAEKHGCRYGPQASLTGDGRVAVSMVIVNAN